MPFPEDEQRQLREIERALYEDDPKFARRMRAGHPWMRYERKLLQVLLGVVIGAGLLSAGAVAGRVWCGRWSAGGGTWPMSGPRVPRRGPGRRRTPSAAPDRPGGPG